MATPTPSYFGLTYDRIIDGTTTGYYWRVGADRTIDWSISNGFSGEYWNNPAALQSEISGMLNTFSYYANVKFNYLGYYTDPSVSYAAGSEINVSLDSRYFFSSPNAWAMAFFPKPTPTEYYGDSGDVFLNLNSQANTLSSYAPGSAGWMVFLHELGHAVGLKHPHDSGAGGLAARPTLEQLGLGAFDIDYATIMSYRDDADWNLRQWDPASPMILDVLALQYLYGKNMSTNAGDNTYSLVRSGFYSTYWDASGTDTVSAAGQHEGWLIMLPNIQLSGMVDTKAGIAIPLADISNSAATTLIWLAGDYENAIGSEYQDGILGSDAANSLFGNGGNDMISGLGGNDTIDGGAGVDTAILRGSVHSYQTQVSGGTRLVSGPDGMDTLVSIERLQLDDVSIAYDVNGDGGQAYRLYQAAFNRTPDQGGLGYWITAMDNGITLNQVAESFINSPEFVATYGALDTSHYVIQLYMNVLHRGPDQGGLDFWTGHLSAGHLTRAETLAQFSESPENQAALIGTIQNGMIYTV